MSTKEAVAHVMRGRRKPMTVAEIAEAALPLAGLSGKTPKQTLYSVLYSENKKADGIVTQVARGTFKLNPARRRG